MILWLASYPRSGNTLLRTVIHQTMGIGCYDSERLNLGDHKPGFNEYLGALFADPPMEWKDFYKLARESEQVFLVKTHFPPMDDQPAIYVVRDGRKACWSYLDFHHKIPHMPDVTLPDIILGYQTYGNWTTHYRAWTQDPQGRRLVVRFEDLVNASSEKVREIAGFINFQGEPKAWDNPFAILQQKAGHFFREGKTCWERPDGWTDLADDTFRILHGELMTELGYMDDTERQRPLATMSETDQITFQQLIRKASHDALNAASLQAIVADLHSNIQGKKLKLDKLQERERKTAEALQRLKEKQKRPPPWKKSIWEKLGWKKS